MRRALFTVLAVLLLVVGANSQTFRGAINGTVTDPSGAVIPGASVEAMEKATGLKHTTVSTTDGEFSFQDIPLGEYKVTVTASGFPPLTVDKVFVSAGMVYTLPVKLSLGQQTTTVEVSAAALALDTTSQVQSTTIPSEVVQDIPLNGRDFTQLITLTPGAGGYNVGGFLSLNGTRANQMNWQIDGVDNNDFWHNIPAVNQGGVSGIAGVILPMDAIDEFSSQTQSNAEAGRNAGGTVNQILKSGGNTLHGSAYYFNRNEAYGAGSPFLPAGTSKPKLRNQNWGASVGGPIIKDRTFYFLNFEKQQYIIGLSGVATEPSLAWEAKATDLLNNPGGTKYGAYAAVTPSALSATLLSTLWPRSLIDSLPATLGNFFSPIASTGYSYNGVIKVDHNFNSKHKLSARWFGGQGSQTAPLGSSPALGTASSNLKNYFEVAPLHVYNYAVVLNSAFTSSLTNQVLFGVNYFNQTFNDFSHGFDTKALGLFLSPDATIKGKAILGAPNVAIVGASGGFEQIGLTPPEGRNDITGILTDIASYSRGKHQFRFGGEFRQGHVNEFYHRRGTGKFSFDGTQGPWAAFIDNCVTTTPFPAACTAAGFSSAADASATGALADYLAGQVSSSSIAVGNPERFVTVNALSFFGQDSWQVNRKLNLNLGLRYEYFGPLHSSKKDLAVFIAGKGLAIQGSGIDNIFPPDKNNFAPRIGFAYQPRENGSLVVRGGIGVYYDQINMNPFLDFRPPISAADGLEDNPIGPSAVSNYSSPFCGGTSYNWETVQQAVCPAGTPNAGTPNATGAIFPGVTTCPTLNGCANIYNVYSVSQNFRAPYFYSYNLQVEKSFGNAAVLQVGYVGSEGRKLSTMLNINQNGTISCAMGCPFTNAGSIVQLNSIGTSNYNSFQTTFRIRSWHGLTSAFAYTWAHALDNGSQYRGVIPLDSFNFKQEYGNGDFDTRHNFTANWAYHLPDASYGPKWLMHGWELTSLWEFHTGQPFNITGGFNRPGLNVVGNPFSGVSHTFVKTPSFTGMQWVNAAAFCVPGAAGCAGTTNPNGNLSRNKFYGPGFGSVDFSVIKNTAITERISAQLHLDMFNLFNRINLASGGGAVNGNGTVTDTIGDFNGAPGIGPGEGFNLQIGLKIKF